MAYHLLLKACLQGLIVSESRGLGPLSVGGGWLVDEPLFRLLVDFEIQKARRLRYSVSVVCFSVASGPAGDGEPSPLSVATTVTRHLRGTDAVALWAQGWLGLLLIDAEASHLDAILHRLITRLETGSWSAGGSSYPRTAIRADGMLRQAVDLMGKAKQEGGNRFYVAS